jgi:hypothetical protein
LIALALSLLGSAVLAAVLSGAIGQSAPSSPVAGSPAVLAASATPAPASASAATAFAGRGTAAGPYAAPAGTRSGEVAASTGSVPSVGAVVASPPGKGESGTGSPYGQTDRSETDQHIPAAWEAGFYPIYAEAQRVFGVNWLLLASIHMQESAFSTAPSTYHGLNFARCCGGPMQFNVTNGGTGIPSTWDLVQNAYRFGVRPTVYDHRTANHPSIYDDFDSIMAAAWLLYSDGAAGALNDSAWWAAYDYYGHDAYGVEYADEVLARAIGWSQHGFCINCGVDPTLVHAVYEAYGAPVMATYTAATAAAHARHAHHTRRRR